MLLFIAKHPDWCTMPLCPDGVPRQTDEDGQQACREFGLFLKRFTSHDPTAATLSGLFALFWSLECYFHAQTVDLTS